MRLDDGGSLFRGQVQHGALVPRAVSNLAIGVGAAVPCSAFDGHARRRQLSLEQVQVSTRFGDVHRRSLSLELVAIQLDIPERLKRTPPHSSTGTAVGTCGAPPQAP